MEKHKGSSVLLFGVNRVRHLTPYIAKLLMENGATFISPLSAGC
jgi:hypothetical protein